MFTMSPQLGGPRSSIARGDTADGAMFSARWVTRLVDWIGYTIRKSTTWPNTNQAASGCAPVTLGHHHATGASGEAAPGP